MEVFIERQTTNDLYTEGRLFINGDLQTYTTESSEIMLPAGNYRLQLITKNAHKRELVVFKDRNEPTGWRLGIAHSWIGSKKTKTIAIGQYFYPGARYKATPDYERIIKRLEKCKARNEAIRLIISDTSCVPSKPIAHWTSSAALHSTVTRNS